MGHGLTQTRLYRTFCNMKQRCYNQNNPKYNSYGGKGVTICQEWLDDFQEFYDWSMANGYADDLTIDRIDNSKEYSPNNCRWITFQENRSVSHFRLGKSESQKVTINALQQRREELKLTKKEVAEAGQISTKQYTRVERGEQEIGVKKALLISKKLESTVEKLFKQE